MNSAAATGRYARGIYNAFAAYKKRHGGSITIPYMPDPIEEKAPAKKVEEVSEKRNEEPKNEEPQAVVSTVETPPMSVTPELQQEAPAKTLEAQESPVNPEPQKVPEAPVTQKAPEAPAPQATSNAPVFKVQILVSSQKLKANDSRLKGQTGVDSYVENGLTKYTVGASENYNEIYHLRKSLLEKFPEAFIIAFKGGQRMDVQQAIKEFKNKRVK